MKNRSTVNLAIILFLLAKVTVAQATIDTEAIQISPASTQDLWAYSYFAPDGDITSSGYYATDESEYSEVVHQGYLTGVGTRPNVDHFSELAGASQATRVFTTYIMSSIDQTVRFSAGGDDGHSVFLDDSFLAGGGFGVNVSVNADLIGGQIYKLTGVSSNRSGHFELILVTSGDLNGGVYGWGGPLSEAQNISMDAIGDFPEPSPAPKPVPAMGIWGLGILSGMIGLLGIYHRRRK